MLWILQIGNAWVDDGICNKGLYDYLWTHALSSDETNEGINKYCNYASEDSVNKKADGDDKCVWYETQALVEMGNIDFYGIYASRCHKSAIQPNSNGNVSIILPK